MKKIITALTLSTLLFFSTACSSDDSSTPPPTPPPTTQELLVGKWKTQETGEIIDGVKIPEEITECEAKGSVEFLKDLNLIGISFEDYPIGECTSDTNKGTWSVDGDQLTTNTIFEDYPEDNDTSISKIIKINSKELQVEFIEESTYGDVTTTYYYYTNFTRL